MIEGVETVHKIIVESAKKSAKSFIDANVWDSEDRSGCKKDSASFSPDDLQELVDELIEHIHEA